jgi:Flp pilus assembly protein TadG
MLTQDTRKINMLRSFLKDQTGGVAIPFSLVLVSILAVTGGAADFARLNTIRTQLQQAVDSAALGAAGSSSDSPDARQRAGQNLFRSNQQNPCTNDANFSFKEDQVTVSAECNVETYFLKIIGFNNYTVSAVSVAGYGISGIEISIVVDVSGSMSNDIGYLRQATESIINEIFGNESNSSRKWVSIVPFGGRVNIANYGTSWFNSGQIPTNSNFSSVGNWGITQVANTTCKVSQYSNTTPKLCAARRPLPQQSDDTPPSGSKLNFFTGDPVVCPVPRAQGLTNTRSDLLLIARNLCAGHGTSTQEGMAWGWRALSPKWRGMWGNSSLPLDYRESPGKVAVIMTDGRNHPGQSGDSISETEADNELLSTCAAMKAVGIKIYAVTFRMGGALSSVYKKCTSKPEFEFAAENGTELINSFRNIGSQINKTTPRLIK